MMLRTIDELMAFTDRMGKEEPILAHETCITKPGITRTEAAALFNALPNLPASYLQVMEALRLDGISIGYFSLVTGDHKTQSVSTRIIQANTNGNPFFAFYQQNNLVEVAHWEADPICVSRKGTVARIDHEAVPLKHTEIASSFEEFLLLAGSLAEVCRSPAADPSLFQPIAKALCRDSRHVPAWDMFARVALS